MPHVLDGDVRISGITCSESVRNSAAKLLVFKYKSMIIQIEMNIKLNDAIIKYFKSYITVIILVIK